MKHYLIRLMGSICCLFWGASWTMRSAVAEVESAVYRDGSSVNAYVDTITGFFDPWYVGWPVAGHADEGGLWHKLDDFGINYSYGGRFNHLTKYYGTGFYTPIFPTAEWGNSDFKNHCVKPASGFLFAVSGLYNSADEQYDKVIFWPACARRVNDPYALYARDGAVFKEFGCCYYVTGTGASGDVDCSCYYVDSSDANVTTYDYSGTNYAIVPIVPKYFMHSFDRCEDGYYDEMTGLNSVAVGMSTLGETGQLSYVVQPGVICSSSVEISGLETGGLPYRSDFACSDITEFLALFGVCMNSGCSDIEEKYRDFFLPGWCSACSPSYSAPSDVYKVTNVVWGKTDASVVGNSQCVLDYYEGTDVHGNKLVVDCE